MMTTTIRHRAHRGVAFAAMLPMTIDLHDLLGREKLGRLPRQLSIDRARREFDYQWESLPTGRPATTSR